MHSFVLPYEIKLAKPIEMKGIHGADPFSAEY